MIDIKEILTRRRNFQGKKYWLTSVSIKSDYDHKWSNCLYLHFDKAQFPSINSPPLRDVDYSWTKKMFEYDKSPLSDLPFHGGITFYEETIHLESSRSYVKVGCDYQHYMDDEYQRSDCGIELLKHDGQELVDAFEELIKSMEPTCQNTNT